MNFNFPILFFFYNLPFLTNYLNFYSPKSCEICIILSAQFQRIVENPDWTFLGIYKNEGLMDFYLRDHDLRKAVYKFYLGRDYEGKIGSETVSVCIIV